VTTDKSKQDVLSWNVKRIATALKITPEEVRQYFTDGRRVSFVLERRLASEVLLGKITGDEGAGYDIVDKDGHKWEVRSITKDGIYFSPSYMVGSGRKFNEEGFLKKLKEVEGYIAADVESFPDVPFWMVPSMQVLRWWKSGKLGTITKVSRKTALKLLNP